MKTFDFKKTKKILLIIVLAIIISVVSATSAFTVNTGEVGIVTQFGKVSRVCEAGISYKIPFVEGVIKMPTRDVLLEKTFNASSQDLQTVDTSVAIQYKIVDPLKVFTSFRTAVEEKLVMPRAAEIVQSITSDYTIEELVSRRQELSNKINTTLKNDLEPYGVLVLNVSITNHDFSDAFEQAIEKKKVAEQEAQAQEVANAQALRNAENNLKVKQLEAEANKVMTESLTENILLKQYIEKWDGKLPQVQGSTSTMIQLPKAE